MSAIDQVAKQIKDHARRVRFLISEYTVETLAQKVRDHEYYVPQYQRNLVWPNKTKSRFIESILIGLPIPPLFLYQADDGRLEIVDGSQRLRTLREFIDNELKLRNLNLLSHSNGLYFKDFDKPIRRHFSEKSIRGIILDNEVSPEVRTELFRRINTSGKQANEAEIRRGSLPGKITDLIAELAEFPIFTSLTPMSEQRIKSREREELITRFLAYVAGFEDDRAILFDYRDRPREYLYQYLKTANERAAEGGLDPSDLRDRFVATMEFVAQAFPNGFRKNPRSIQIPRARFEAISVGSALALASGARLRVRPEAISHWIDCEEFASIVASDGANVRKKLMERVHYVRTNLESDEPES